MSMISYTRNFEDVMLYRALKHIQDGFYVDVGASHPVMDSNTYWLYTQGWRGLGIEPQQQFNDVWAQYRPEDVLLNAGVSGAEGEMTLYKPVDYGQAATTCVEFANDYARRGLAITQSQVPIHTLTNLLLKTRPSGEIHLLSIDVEGAERGVVEGLDWSRFRPWLVVLESTLPGVPTPNFANWESLLLAQGYEFVYFDAVNRFYVAQEHAELKQYFEHPPCVWDDFTAHEVIYLREQQSQQRTLVIDLNAQIQVHKDRLNAMSHWLLVSAKRFESLGDIAGYEAALWHIFELNPTYADVYWPLGGLLTAQNRRAEALAFYQKTVQHTPLDFYSHHNIGMLLRWEKRWEESETAFKRMMAIKPDFSEGRMNYGALLLALGRYEEGWPLFESRYLVFAHETPKMQHNAPYPRWTGESLEGKSIIIMREQGFGDEIMFARFAIDLKIRGAVQVAILCQPALRSLFQTMPSVDQVICAEDLTRWPSFDFWVYGQSLPCALGITLSTLPAPIPYLHPALSLKRTWRARIAQAISPGLLKVGITWRGSPTHGNDAHRSLDSMHVMRSLWRVPGIQFISLQTGSAASEAAQPPKDQPVLEWGSQMGSFESGAALVSELDLVISVDTALVHLAGALGIPCWVMIPAHETDWRWLIDRSDSPWYPQGLRIYRQKIDFVWDEVIEQVQHDLSLRVQEKYVNADIGH
jgi:FkbM family methyltransferase